jgi:dTDP-4-dehydrorhamnose reductase
LRVLLLGRDGQVGAELLRAAPPSAEIVAPGLAETDLTRPGAAREAVRRARPDLIVNAAAYTDVDGAEADPAAARLLNAAAPEELAAEAARVGSGIIHYSTDYVYDGAKAGPWTEDDAPAPLGAYGASKLAGDRAVLGSGARALILRTSWVYAAHGRNFVRTMLRLGGEQEELRVVADQRGCPTWARDLARATWAVAARGLEPAGLFHCAGSGAATWHEFACRVIALARARGARLRVNSVAAIATAERPTAARRPRNSMLDCARLQRAHGLRLPPWEESLAACLDELCAPREAAQC